MITKSNPTPPIDGKEYELIYKTHRIGPFAHDIYGLLVDYGNTDDSVDNYPVENFTERLSFARDFAQTLVSLLENGVDLNGVTIKDEKYVSPIVAAMKHNLYQCILEMETELRHNEESASSLCNSYDPADDEYAEYHHPIPIPNNAKRLDDWLVSNRRVMDMLPGSVIIASLLEPLTKEVLEPIVTDIQNAYDERMRVKDLADRDIKLNHFLCSVFALGVPEHNEVFRDLYDSLKMFHRIPEDVIPQHEANSDKHVPGNYVRLMYKRLKDKGMI